MSANTANHLDKFADNLRRKLAEIDHRDAEDREGAAWLLANGPLIVAALQRVEAGTYGVCIDCHKPIPRVRLRACPEAERCVKCQSIYESRHAPQPLRVRWAS